MIIRDQTPSWGPATPIDFVAADINQDGQVTASDALDVLRTAVGLHSSNQPRWIFIDPDADLSSVDRENTFVQSGITFDRLPVGVSDLSMTGVLLGSVQEFV